MEAEDEARGRSSFRFKLPCSVQYQTEEGSGSGSLLDISAGGVNIEKATHALPLRSHAQLSLHFGDACDPVQVQIEVVRQTANGFAGRFVNLHGKHAVQLWDRLSEALKSLIS